MNDWFSEIDFNGTIKDFEFTRKAAKKMRSVHERMLESDGMYTEEADVIAAFLLSEMETVSFGDFLKRYIYERAGIQEPFRLVPDKVFQEIIIETFRENAAPQSFSPTTKRWSATAKDWLTRDSVRRKTIFLIGFGLGMSTEDVSEFLTKVIKEEDFDFKKAEEAIFWFCYRHGLKYPKAELYLQEYERLREEAAPSTAPFEPEDPPRLDTEEQLMKHLRALSHDRTAKYREEQVREEFLTLIEEVKNQIALQFEQEKEEEWSETRHRRGKEISYGDIERIICSGIPLNEKLNLTSSSASRLTPYFKKYRMTRQRLDGVTKGRYPVERFDLITLKFYLYASRMEGEDPIRRYQNFVEDTNALLAKCGMMDLYPVNPYEAFVMICLLSEFPLDSYNEVWEYAYQET